MLAYLSIGLVKDVLIDKKKIKILYIFIYIYIYRIKIIIYIRKIVKSKLEVIVMTQVFIEDCYEKYVIIDINKNISARLFFIM